ncbi:CD109 antigen-like isoform X3 [Branchiostoma lanceolatum]|uniref:CD109 antigen-like isoform X3 n=1 Tax=Branchiostoma lanceolatum TaxID=7740 RepID=UPI003452265C
MLGLSLSFHIDKMRGLLLLCVLGSVLAQRKLEPTPSPTPGTPGTFLIMAPKVVRPGRPLTMSVSILDPAAASVQVTATLLQNGRPTGTPASGDFSPSADGTLDLVVPGDLTAGSAYKLKVEGTGGLTFTEEKDLTFNSKSSSIFVQTDKGKYKPGQTVKMRAIAVDAELKTKKEQFDIDIFDPQGNKIVQWRGLQNDDGIVEKEFPLSDQPILGDWKIVAKLPGGDEAEQPFGVEEYVLPKFEVTISTSSFFAKTEDNLQGTFNAKYTYGKNVEGQGKVTVMMRSAGSDYRPTDNSIELNAIAMTEGSGSFQFSRVDIESLYHPDSMYYGSYQLELIVEVTEGLTGNTQEATKELDLVQTKYKLEFFNTPDNFKPGLQYTAYLRTSYHDGTPMLGMDLAQPVTLTKSYGYNGPTAPPPEELTIPQSGVIKIVTDVPSDANSMSLSVTYNDISETAASHSAEMAESPSSSYIQVITSTPEVMAGDAAQFTVKSTTPISYFSYQILSRGNIVAADRVDVTPEDTLKSFTVPTVAQMAPSSRMVVYWMTDTGEVCNDGLTFTVKGAFENQVSLSYDKDRAEPAEDIAVTVRADPDSLVALLTVDQSVLLLASGNDITQEKVLAELEEYDPAEDSSGLGGPEIMWRRRKRSIWWPMPTSGADAHAVFENAGVIVITDAMVYQKQPDYWWQWGIHPVALEDGFLQPPMLIQESLAGVMDPSQSLGGGGTALQEVKQVRSFFPETWLWSNARAGSDGTAVFTSTVPDTMTSWIASAFALNDNSGLGVADTPASMEAFRPFFVSLNLPYSVVNKEQTAIQALVFNYMDVDMDVTVTLEGSDGFMHLVMDTNDVNSIGTETAGNQAVVLTVPAGTSRSKSFPIVPKRFGAIPIKVSAQSTLAADAVERQLLVEPEGEQKEYTKSVILDLGDSGGDVTQTLSLSLPPSGMVDGSAYCRVSVMGDMMGSTISGLDSLLQMPHGCGEQTMITFAPNVYVMYYLDQTDQVTPEIEEKALKFMTSGYQRELTYTHNDGSFSAFGTSDDSGSSWLTAFVVKSFAQAAKFTFIDPKVQAKAVRWLMNQQQSNGVFTEPGRVIHKEMQGGLSSDVTMTSYILVGLMEYNKFLSTLDAPDSDKVDVTGARDLAVSFLESRLDSETDVYTVVTMTYALTLAGSSRKDDAFQKMNSLATTDAGQKYWTKGESATPPPVSDDLMWTPPYHDTPSADVEMTAYALLTYLARDNMIEGIPIMKWLSEQRNAYGGYSSTQDTVVGLEALGYFAAGVRAGGLDMTVTITSDTDADFSHTFTVNDQNAIVLQQVEIPNVSGTLSARAQGQGMGLLQLFVRYNVDVVDPVPSFGLTAVVKNSDTNSVTCETCGQYRLGGSSGMAVMEIGLPSGFYVEEADLMALVANQNLPTLKRAERSTDNKKAVLYFDEMNDTPTCVTLTSHRSMPVAKTQPSVVKVFDYYKPDVKASNVYQSETLKNTNICDVCDDCTGCRTRRSPQNTNGGPALAMDTLLGVVLVLLTRLFVR